MSSELRRMGSVKVFAPAAARRKRSSGGDEDACRVWSRPHHVVSHLFDGLSVLGRSGFELGRGPGLVYL